VSDRPAGPKLVPETEAAPVPVPVPVTDVAWERGVRIIRSVFPPIDLFEDIAAPEDWPLLISAEQKTNPRLMDSIGNLDLIPPERRVGGAGASYLMAPFTHTSPDRPSRFSDGRFVHGADSAGARLDLAVSGVDFGGRGPLA